MKPNNYSDLEKKLFSLKAEYRQEPSETFLYTCKGRLISRIKNIEEEKRQSTWFSRNLLPARKLAIGIFLFFTIGFSATIASASALPGQILYPVKRLNESFALATSLTPKRKASYKIEIAKRRATELIELVDQGDLEETKKASEELKKAVEESKEEIENLPSGKRKEKEEETEKQFEKEKKALEEAAEKSDKETQKELEKAIRALETKKEAEEKDEGQVEGEKDEKKEKKKEKKQEEKKEKEEEEEN